MLISLSQYYALLVGLLAVAFVAVPIMQRAKRLEPFVLRVEILVWIAIVGFGASYFFVNHVFVASGVRHQESLLYGNQLPYRFANGSTKQLSVPFFDDAILVVNDTPGPIAAVRYSYGHTPNTVEAPKREPIEPYTLVKSFAPRFDHFGRDPPPATIKGHPGGADRYWLSY